MHLRYEQASIQAAHEKFALSAFEIAVAPLVGTQYRRYTITWRGTPLRDQLTRPDFDQCVTAAAQARHNGAITRDQYRALKQDLNAQTGREGAHMVLSRLTLAGTQQPRRRGRRRVERDQECVACYITKPAAAFYKRNYTAMREQVCIECQKKGVSMRSAVAKHVKRSEKQ